MANWCIGPPRNAHNIILCRIAVCSVERRIEFTLEPDGNSIADSRPEAVGGNGGERGWCSSPQPAGARVSTGVSGSSGRT